MQKRLECQVFGRVQMVMFRDFVQRKARARGLVGTVQNNPDESVAIVAQGEEAALRELLDLIRRGPILARVDRVEKRWSEPFGEYRSFDILYEREKKR